MSSLKKVISEVKLHNGVPTLHINGQPNAGMVYMTYDRSFNHVHDFSQSTGVKIISFSTTCDHSYYNLAPDSLKAPGQFDFSDFDSRVHTILKNCPDAYLIPRIYICTPPWWNEAHPDEMSKGHKEVTSRVKDKPFPSVSSKLWKKVSSDALTRFIAYAEKQEYSDRIIGYHLASLTSEEWYYNGYWSDVTEDFSAPQQQAFRKWLKRSYHNIKNLREVWGDNKITFQAAVIPSRSERLDTDWGEFRNVVGKDRRVADYYQFHSEAVADLVCHFSSVAKLACSKTKIIGSFYGYLFELCGGGMGVAESGHAALMKVLNCQDIDFLSAPSSYCFRRNGIGASSFAAPIASIKKHQKLWFNENDYRTHLVKTKGQNVPKEINDTINLQLRELIHVLSEGCGMWWFDMSGGWYAEPELMQSIGKMNKIAENSIQYDRSPVAEIAVIVDEKSMAYMRQGTHLAAPLISDQRLEISKIGAPVDYLLLDDLPDSRPYKFYIFLNAFNIEASRLKWLKKLLRSGDKMSLWLSGAGLLNENVSSDNIKNLTGIEVSVLSLFGTMDLCVSPNTCLTQAGAPAGQQYGSQSSIYPLFVPNNKKAEIIACSSLTGHNVMAIRQFKDWSTVYCSAPNVPSAILRSLAQIAKVHIYSADGDAFYANKSFLGFNASTSGTRTINLPIKSDIYDLYSDTVICRKQNSFKIQAKKASSYLFCTEPITKR